MVTIRVPSEARRARAAGDPQVRHHAPGAAGAGGLAALLAGGESGHGVHLRLLEAGVLPAGAGGLDCLLYNAKDVKHLPGRPKTDLLDAAWLARSPSGVARRSFVPPAPIRRLRALPGTAAAGPARTAEKQRAEKLLEDAHLKLSSVISDIHGVSGRDMLRAIIAGERNPKVLAQMARGVMRRKIARLEEALDCSFFTPHHAFLLQMMLGRIDHLTAQIAVLDAKIAALCDPYERQVAQLDGIPGSGSPPPGPDRRVG